MSVLSRYLARMLLARTAILLAGLAALMVILAFLADGDQVIAASEGVVLAILRYTLLRLPEIMAQLIPITAVLASLLTLAELVRHSELTAMHAAGLSKPRLVAAVLPVALLIALAQFLIEDQAAPRAIGALRAWGIGDYGGSGEKYILVLAGEDPKALQAAAFAVEKDIRTIPGIGQVASTASLIRPEVVVRPDFTRAADLGVTSTAIGETLRIATAGDYDNALPKLNLSQRQVPIVVTRPRNAVNVSGRCRPEARSCSSNCDTRGDADCDPGRPIT